MAGAQTVLAQSDSSPPIEKTCRTMISGCARGRFGLRPVPSPGRIIVPSNCPLRPEHALLVESHRKQSFPGLCPEWGRYARSAVALLRDGVSVGGLTGPPRLSPRAHTHEMYNLTVDLPAFAEPLIVVSRWRWKAKLWQYLHYGPGIIGVVLSGMIAAGIVSDPVWVKRSGFVTGTMASIVTILKPKSKAEAYIFGLFGT